MPKPISITKRGLIGSVPCERRTIQLSHLEQQYVRQAVEHLSSGLLFAGMRLEVLDLNLMLNQLPIALQVLQRRHPMLRCSIGSHKNLGYVFEEDPTLLVPVEIRNRKGNPIAWRLVWEQEFENSGMKLYDNGLRVLVFCDQDQTICELVLAMQHHICDGTSISFLIHELLGYLMNQTLPETVPWGNWPIPMMDHDLLVSKYPRTWAGHYLKQVSSLLEMSNVLAPGIVPVPHAKGHDGWQLFRNGAEMVRQSTTHMINYELSTIEMQMLLKRCREEKTTVTSAVTTAFVAGEMQAMGANLDSCGATVSVVCSMRSTFGVNNHDNLSPYVSNLVVNVFPKGSSTKDLWQASRLVKDNLHAFPEETKLWNTKHCLGVMMHMPIGSNLARVPGLVVSSFGNNAVQCQYGSIKVLDNLYAQNSRQVPTPTLSMNNMLSGRLNLVFLTPTPRYDPALAERIFRFGLTNLYAMMQDKTARL
ncbi:hypothetical protein BASA81_000139 [Batrachochytrium salamandrivorans]|nr:hypothetical protein BASA81_000139 [Batrachochytrium salamandrivorans]